MTVFYDTVSGPRQPAQRAALRWALWSRCLLLGTVGLLLSGCAFLRLHRDLATMRPLASLRGTVEGSVSTAPIAVLLYTAPPGEERVVDAFVLRQPGLFFFVAPAGHYRIAAFRDLNGDFVYQPASEPAAYYGLPTDIEVAQGAEISGLDLAVPEEVATPLAFPLVVPELGRRGIHALPDKNIGTVVDIGDPRFSAANGSIGMWEPMRFLFEVGAGIYFFEPYDPEKTPVLFVHGIGGDPRNFEYLVSQLDRKRFQPWMLYYPSGIRLELIARYTLRWMKALWAQYRFEHLAVVAHSMGGLVARSFINQNFADADHPVLDGLESFITISTPWNGHRAAELGVRQAPVVVPSWIDMVPNSEFLQSLFAQPLPSDFRYYLFFSFRGRRLAREANDRIVTLSSQLARAAQEAAVKVYGFNEDHVSILNSAAVAAQLNQLLAAEEP